MTTFVPLKRLVDPRRPLTYGIVQAGEDVVNGVPYIRPVDMLSFARDLDPGSLRTTSADIAGAYRRSTVQAGDLVVSIGPSYGKLLIVPPRVAGANLTQGTARVAPAEQVDVRFLQWALASPLARAYWEASVGGATFGGLNLGPLAMTPVPLVEPEQQRRIADFLDRECRKLEALEQEIAGYEALVSEPSLARFAELTRHMPHTKITYRFDVQLGKMLDEKRVEAGDTSPYLRNVNVQWDQIRLHDLKEMTFNALDRVRYSLCPGDLLVCEGGEPGRAAVWQGERGDCYYQKALIRVRPRLNDSTRFLMWALWLASRRGDFAADGTGSTILHLPAERLAATRIPSCSAACQREIVEEVDGLAAWSRTARNEVTQLRSSLADYRDALIAEAVTGNLEVPETFGGARPAAGSQTNREGNTVKVRAG